MYFALIFLFRLTGVFMYTHQRPLEEKIWSERCKKNSVVLNDCNWCWCDLQQRYQCKARVCEEIDMFGHFKDAIQEIDVGMEGRGSWRSKSSSCTPGVHYRRGNVLCVCDEDGNWPNPVCRDLFRVLHSVEVTGQIKFSNNESCTPTKLYLLGCNVCFCPSSGILDPELCTKKECEEDDPVLEANNGPELMTESPKNVNQVKDLEIYATCNRKYKYKLGCMKCDCIGTNRLLCYNCSLEGNYNDTSNQRPLGRKNIESYCNGRTPGKIFYIGCNSCHCDKELHMYCTAKKCIQGQYLKLKSKMKISKKIKLKQVEAPPDDESCMTRTQYKRNCNICKCVKLKDGKKLIDCTLNKCANSTPIVDQKHDCVEGTFYELDCKVCHCYTLNKVKHQVCHINDECVNDVVRDEKSLKASKDRVARALHGYCDPLHKYQNNCNKCRCLSDGKTLKCSSKRCIKRSSESLSVEIVPVRMSDSKPCPKGYSYKLDCNLCFCLSNGNAICTTTDCSNENKI